MRTWNSLKISGAVVVGTLVAFNVSAYLAFDTANGTPGNVGGQWNLGEEFIANQAINITQLGAFDSLQDRWGSDSVTVAIYDFNTHNLVGSSVTLNAGNPGTILSGESGYGGNSSYRYQSVNFQLNPGTYLIVAGGLGTSGNNPNTLFYNSNGGLTPIITDTGGGLISFVAGGNYWSDYTSGFGYPVNQETYNGSGPIGRYGAGSFDFTPVPEATAFGAAGVGLLGLVYIVRCTRLRRNMSVA